MVLYTPAVTADRGSDAAVRTLVNLGISETNTSYANSGIAQRLRLVFTGEVGYSESGDMADDLDNVTTSAGALSNVAALRNAYAADLVSLWVHYPSPQYCGIAWMMTTISASFAPNAYNAVDDQCVSPNYSFAHEMGHNMGAGHDWFVDSGTLPTTYAHGYVYAPGAWRTIMAYNDSCVAQRLSCTRLLAWATPTRTFNGVPMGVAAGTSTACTAYNPANPPCDADDARLLNETASTVANFRQALPAPLAVTSLVPSVGSPSPVNTAVSWTASTSGGTGPLTYKFVIFDGSQWTVARDWSASNAWTWTPTAPGLYSIQVWVRDAGSSALYDAWGQADYTITGPPALTVTSVIASPASTSALGSVVSWTATAAGGAGPYTYEFFVFDGVSWTVGRDWSPANTWMWSPPAVGTFSIEVWVRNAGSVALYDAYGDSGIYVVTAPPPLTITALGSAPAAVGTTNSPVVWSAAATGGTGPYTFKFLLWNGTAWSLGQDWSAAPSWTWMPGAAGTYAVQVWARNAGSSAVYDAWRGSSTFTVTGPAPLAITSLTADRLFPLPAGTPVTWVGTASGGTGPYTFKYLIFNGTAWAVARDWSASNTWMWVPPSAGTYAVQIWARNAGSAAIYDSWSGAPPVTISTSTPLTVSSLTVGTGSMSAPLGSVVPVVATAIGGVGPYTYKFVVYDGTSWFVGQDWSTSSVWNWVSAADGVYSLQVWVRNAGSTAAWDAWRGSVPFTVTAGALSDTGGRRSAARDVNAASPFREGRLPDRH
jgi:hypothetical protein